MNETTPHPGDAAYRLDILPEPEARYLSRHYRRLEKILMWLCHFHHSTYPILCHVGGYSTIGRNALATHIRKGIVATDRMGRTGTSERLFRLSPAGWRQASSLVDFTNPEKPPQKANTTLWHDLNIQHELLSRPEKIRLSQIESAKAFAVNQKLIHPGETPGKIPDYVLRSGDRAEAVEIELTRKNPREIYAGLLAHMQQITNKELYTHARYVFDRAVVRNHYHKLAHKRIWPVYRRGRNNQLVRDDRDWIRHRQGTEDYIDKYLAMTLMPPGHYPKGMA